MTQFPRSPARPSPTQTIFNARIERVQSKLVHAAELIADKMVEQHSQKAAEQTPVEVRRRAMANALQIWRRCAQKTCRRTQACRGEPAHCLDACMPALPQGTLTAYIASSRRRRKR
jgi:hypothetical protein